MITKTEFIRLDVQRYEGYIEKINKDIIRLQKRRTFLIGKLNTLTAYYYKRELKI